MLLFLSVIARIINTPPRPPQTKKSWKFPPQRFANIWANAWRWNEVTNWNSNTTCNVENAVLLYSSKRMKFFYARNFWNPNKIKTINIVILMRKKKILSFCSKCYMILKKKIDLKQDYKHPNEFRFLCCSFLHTSDQECIF